MALDESREKPNEELRITTSFGIGMGWLTPRLGPFLDLYPGIKLEVILADEELDRPMSRCVCASPRSPTS